MARCEAKTRATAESVKDFIASLENETRRTDANTLLKVFADVTGWKPRMWGPSIIGYGAYEYTYDSGHSGSICAVGFSPRKANLAIYVADFPGKEALLKRLGKHKGGLQQCLYVNKLSDVRLDVLEEIIRGSLAELKRTWTVTPS